MCASMLMSVEKVKLLTAFGARQTTPRGDLLALLRENLGGDVAGSRPEAQQVFRWLSRTRGVNPFLAAVAGHMPKVARWLLRRGRADPTQHGGPAACLKALALMQHVSPGTNFTHSATRVPYFVWHDVLHCSTRLVQPASQCPHQTAVAVCYRIMLTFLNDDVSDES